jgi:hypothetical protein
MTIVATAVEADGWVLAVTGTWAQTPGAWNFSGVDRTNGQFLSAGVDQFPLDSGGVPKVVLAVRSAGFDRVNGQPVANVSRPRTVVATKALRQPTPNHLQLDEVDNGNGTRTVRLALSDRIFAGDVITQASFLAGWKAGHSGGTLTSVGNASTRAVPLIISRWAMRPSQLVRGSAAVPNHLARVEVIIAAHFPEHVGPALNQACAAMRLMATDGATAKYFWFSQTYTSPLADGLRCWGGTIDLSGLNPGLITVHREIYPFVGASRATGTMTTAGHNTSLTNAQSNAHDTPLMICYDPTGTRYTPRYVRVDAASALTATTDSGSVGVYATLAEARAAPLSACAASIGVALQGMRTFCDANVSATTLAAANGYASSTRSADFWEIILTDGQVHSWGPSMTGTGTQLGAKEGVIVVRGDPAAANPRASVTLRSGTSGASAQNFRWLFRDLRIEFGQASFVSVSANVWAVENCDLTGKPGFESNSNGFSSGTTTVGYLLDCASFNYVGQPVGQLVRNCTRTRGWTFAVTLISSMAKGTPGAFLGAGTTFGGNVTDYMVWGCKLFGLDGALFGASAVACESAAQTGNPFDPRIVRRVAFVNNQVEAVSTALVQLGEGSNGTMRDSVWEGNTIVGNRLNFHGYGVAPVSSAGSTVTLALEAHGLGVGSSVTVAGCLPAAYNGTFTVASVPNAHQFTYVAASTPGAMTVRGTVTLPGGTVRPIVRERVRNTGNSLRNNIIEDNGSKQDLFAGDPEAIGSWEMMYAVGYRDNVLGNRDATSPLDFQPSWYGVGSDVNNSGTGFGTNYYGFVEDLTGRGPGPATYGGDYRLAAGSRAIGLAEIASIDRTADGQERGVSFGAGALAALAAVVPAAAPARAMHGQRAGASRLAWMGALDPVKARHSSRAGAGRLAGQGPEPSGEPVGRIVVVEPDSRGIAVGGD